MRLLVRFLGFLFAAGTVVFLVGVAGELSLLYDDASPVRVLPVLLTVTAGTALLGRRRHPVLVLAAMLATTGLSRWLADAYGLTPQDIAAVLGTAMEYEIAEVVDSEYDVVAKVSKDALAHLGK